MKRQFIYGAMMLALASAAVSCSDDNVVEVSDITSTQLKKVTIHASSTIGNVGGNTRANLGDDGVTPVWQENDEIAVLIDDATKADNLKLSSNAGTGSGSFSGEVTVGNDPQNMYFYYPTTAASEEGVDLTVQDGSNAKEMVMFATCAYSKTPAMTFGNKTSILKFNMTVPAESGWSTESTLTATVIGAYSKGKLSKKGEWSDLEAANIKVTNVKVDGGKISGYAVVIPGTNVTDLRIAITDDTKAFVTQAYTSATTTVPVNQVVTISKALSKALLWTPSTTKADDVRTFLGDGIDLTIFAADEMTYADFVELKNALSKDNGYADGTINLTLLNQTSLPGSGATGALESCKSLKFVSAPNVTVINTYALSECTNLTSVSLPKATSVGIGAFGFCDKLTTVSLPEATSVGKQAFYYCEGLTTVSLPEATSVGDQAFGHCNKLATVSLPKATSVDLNAFYECDQSEIDLTTSDASGWYMQWDDVEEHNYGWKSLTIIKVNFKVIYTDANYKTWSTDNCSSAPTAEQMKMYLGAGVYWDDGTDITDGNQQTYKLPNGGTYHAGLWVMKKEYIEGFSAGSAKAIENTDDDSSCWHVGRPATSEIGKYFFLPAAGQYYYDGYEYYGFLDAGSCGNYWSRSSNDGGFAFYLEFRDSGAYVYNYDTRGCDLLPMVAE